MQRLAREGQIAFLSSSISAISRPREGPDWPALGQIAISAPILGAVFFFNSNPISDSCRPMVLNNQWESTRVTFRSQQGSRLEDQTLQLRTVRDEVPQRPAQHLRAAAQGRSEFLWEMMSLKRLVQTRRIRVHRQVQPRGQG